METEAEGEGGEAPQRSQATLSDALNGGILYCFIKAKFMAGKLVAASAFSRVLLVVFSF